MATKKKDLLNQDTTGVNIPDTTEGTVSGDLSVELPAIIQPDEGTGDTALDLNELLSSMDQQSETDNGDMIEDLSLIHIYKGLLKNLKHRKSAGNILISRERRKSARWVFLQYGTALSRNACESY